MKTIKPYLLLIIVLVADILIIINNPELGSKIVSGTRNHIMQMLAIIPPIFLLIGLLDVWVPRETIMKFMGEKSGIKGTILSILLGAAAAGPLYAAFPLAGIMLKKGVKFTNVMIFLGAWSTMKIPMVLFEVSYLGKSFALTRWLLSLAGIILMAWLINRIMSDKDKDDVYNRHVLSQKTEETV